MIKRISVSLLAMITCANVFAQSIPESYTTAVTKFKQYFNSGQPDSTYKMFGPEVKSQLSFEQFKNTMIQLKGQLGYLTETRLIAYNAPVATYNSVFNNAELTLKLSLNDQKQIIGLLFQPKTSTTVSNAPKITDPLITESPVSLKTFEGVIHGTLTMPKNASGKLPVVLIIAGSGPTNRDGNGSGLNGNSYKMLAADLAHHNIASVRYDKRLVGESISSTKESQLKIEDYVEDADGLIHMLTDDKRFSKLIVLGHSEGSLIGMLAIKDEPAVKGFISVAGAGEPADKILTEQMKSQPYYISEGFKRMLDSLRKGKLTPDIDPALYFIARPSIQTYLMSWCKYDPARVLKKVKIPTLILQGTTDIQVSVDNAEKLKKAKSDARLEIIQGMNHIMKEAPTDRTQNIATYSKPDLPLKPELVNAIVSFVDKTP